VTAGPFGVFARNRDFRWLFVAELVIFGGDWFVLVPLLGLLNKLTGGGLAGSLALAVDTGLGALLLPYTGTVADRVNRRTIVVVANLSAVLGIALLFIVHTGRTAWLALAAVGTVALAKAFAAPAVSAAIPNLVEPADLSAAVALTSTAWGTMTVVGASTGGLLAAALSPYTCFAMAAVSLAIAAALTYGVRRPMQRPREHGVAPPRTLAAIRESLRYLAGAPRVRAVVTVKSAVGLGNGVLAVFPALAALLHTGSAGTGLLFGVRGAGALIGPFLLRAVIRWRGRLLPVLAGSMTVYGLGYLAVAVTPWFPVILGLILVAHTAGAGNWAMSSAALQAAVPDALRGRVLATDLMIVTIVISGSQVLVGLFIDHTPPRVLVAACGAVTILYALAWRGATRRLVGDSAAGTEALSA